MSVTARTPLVTLTKIIKVDNEMTTRGKKEVVAIRKDPGKL